MIKNLNTYRKKSEAVITHRCKGSLKAGISIRHGKGWFEGNAWRMWKPITDSDWIDIEMQDGNTVRYKR